MPLTSFASAPRARLFLGFALVLGFGLLTPAQSRAADDEVKATPVWTEPFDNDNRGWIGNTRSDDWSATIAGGLLIWQNRHAHDAQGTLMSVVVSLRRHPELSLDVHLRPGNAKSGAGLQWGTSNDRRDFLYFLISADGRYRIGRCASGILTDFTSGEAGKTFRPDAFNRLVVRMLGGRTAFFVNGAVVWVGATEQFPGSMLGPVVEAGGAAEFDNIQIGYLRVEDTVIAAQLAAYEAAVGDPAKLFTAAPAETSGAGFDIARSDKTVPPATLQAWFKEAFTLCEKQRFEDAEKILRKILSYTPEDTNSHVQLAWCLLNRNVVPEAKVHADLALLFDPLALAPNLIASYAAAAAGDWTAAERALNFGFFLDYEGTALPFVQKDMDDLIRNGRGPAYADRFKAMLAERHANRSRDFTATGATLIQATQAREKGDYAAAEQHARAAAAAAAKLPADQAVATAYVNAVAGYLLYYSDDPRRGRPFLEEAYTRFERTGPAASAYVRARNASLLADLALSTSEPARASEITAAALDATLALPIAANGLKTDLLKTACRADNLLQKYDALRTHANRLLTIRETGRDAFYQALAQNFIGASYIVSSLPPDRQRAREAFERGLTLARDGGYDDLAAEISGNLALSYWQAGDRERAKNTYLDLVSRDELRDNFSGAELSLNNLAAMQYFGGDYAGAAVTFRRAVALSETARAKLSGEERIHFLAGRLSAYQYLVLCLQRAGDAAGLFEAMNSFRARSLAETLNLGEAPASVTLAQFQQTLAPDEAAVFYSLIGPAEIVAQVVTRESANAVYKVDYPGFVGLKQKYLDRLHAGKPGYKPTGPVQARDGLTYKQDLALQLSADDFDGMVELVRGLIDSSIKASPEMRAKLVPEFLGAFRALLIAPVEASLAGRKKLILFPDGILNFMPFEALPEAGGHYLVERFDVRYCQSAAVWQLLHARNYPTADRLPFFGMGGAVFSAMQEKAPPADNQSRLVELQLRAHQNVVANRPQREVFAALFGNEPMHYLRGSLIEVRELSKIFAGATVFTGADMTENRVKQMARDGSLRRFRVIHFATHGFAIPEVPELSGVAMSIFPAAQDGEDGYLTAPEIAQLGLQADLTVLSACQTALGRIYGGEGVAGLTGALLMGGSNRAIVSLWPVNDAGTMHFMQELYALTTREGKTYDEAVNIVKRHFIAGNYGEEFRDIQIWAPFVHYGL